MIWLQQNKKRWEPGKKCHARTMMHSKPIKLSKWTHVMCRSGQLQGKVRLLVAFQESITEDVHALLHSLHEGVALPFANRVVLPPRKPCRWNWLQSAFLLFTIITLNLVYFSPFLRNGVLSITHTGCGGLEGRGALNQILSNGVLPDAV